MFLNEDVAATQLVNIVFEHAELIGVWRFCKNLQNALGGRGKLKLSLPCRHFEKS